MQELRDRSHTGKMIDPLDDPVLIRRMFYRLEHKGAAPPEMDTKVDSKYLMRKEL